MAENQRLRERLGQVEPRIVELERLLEELRRAAKRQSAPFSKNEPKEESQALPARPRAAGLWARNSKTQKQVVRKRNFPYGTQQNLRCGLLVLPKPV